MAPPGFEHWRANIPHGHPYHPWGWHAHRYSRRFGFGRRVFWFGFGAFAAMAWARHHGMTRMSVEGERGRGEWDGGVNGGCRRVEYSPRLVPEDEKRERWGWGHGWNHHRRSEQSVQQPAPQTPAPAPPVAQSAPVQVATVRYSPAPSPPTAGTAIPAVEQQWESDMRNYTRQASDRVTEMSEATIDSLVSGLQGLKTRLAERRAEMQKQFTEDERKRQ
ncbi:hypothetical protein PENSPDRAFT_688474 [Peniophora sp. CONT]|nr:hypothetical protein PENSPDRAFT_688474 [Peniophora sp. CONT]